MSTKKNATTASPDTLTKIWGYTKRVFQGLWEIIQLLVRLVMKILIGAYLLIKSIAFSLSALIAAFSLLIIAAALSVYLISIGFGLKESDAFTSWREDFIATHQIIYQEHQQKWLQRTLSNKEYQVAEITDEQCEVESDCNTPESYLIRSVCPYTSKCLQNRCAVVCPTPFNGVEQ